MIEVSDLRKNFGETRALDGLDLGVRPGGCARAHEWPFFEGYRSRRACYVRRLRTYPQNECGQSRMYGAAIETKITRVAQQSAHPPKEAAVFIAVVQFPTVPTSCDADFREWFAWSNHELRNAVGLTDRRLLVGADNTYVGLVEHESADTFAQMHASPQAHEVQQRLFRLLDDEPHAKVFDVVEDLAAVKAHGSCCGGHQETALHGEPGPATKHSCCS